MKKSKLLLVAWVLSSTYFVYLVSYFFGTFDSASGAEQIGVGIAGFLLMPHAFLVLLGIIFNVLGWSMNKRGFALTGGILYSVSMLLFIPYFFFVIIQAILSFIGFAKMKPSIA